MATRNRRLPFAFALLLFFGLVFSLAAAAEPGAPVSLTVEQVRINDFIVHVGTIENPRPNMGVMLYTEIFEGLWMKVVSGSEELEILPLDESGRFARVAYFGDTQTNGRQLLPVEYIILDLDNLPEELTQENAEAAALAFLKIMPEERDYQAAMSAAPDGMEKYPEMEALLEKLSEQ